MSYVTAYWKPLGLLLLAFCGTFLLIEPPPLAENKIDHRSLEWAAGGTVIAMEQPQRIKVMTFNIRHGRGLDGRVNLQRIAREMKDSKADVIALQEVDRFHIRSGLKDQVKHLADLLGMNWAFAPSLRMGMTSYGNAVLSKYPIVQAETYKLPGIKESRALQKVVVLIDHKEVTIFNTHLGLLPEERSQQLMIISELLRETDGPAILLGDFNMESNHPLMNMLNPEWQKLHMKAKSPTIVSGLEIDHVFVNQTAHMPKVWTMPTDASDHHPVVAEFYWDTLQRIMLASAH